ncbi:dihydrolipoyl dehydrogenase family protein [Propionicicella superfundia]|uniref:dihydrolipoyl dehydrogenase family protein n=1 Tax=Propionicicella superfundia TaxID=348582 RepID=UPI000423DD41|nr:NAD(P)/FAD-dependent oxidoreductase [Propionicicella superfundia]
MDTMYDVIVVGAGPVGENVADRTTRGGLRTALVEGERVGGECSYWACMPSKALLRSGAALRAARAVGGAAQAVTGDLDVGAVLARRDRLTHGGDDTSQVEWVASAGIELIRGHGRLAGERIVQVTAGDGRAVTLTARHAVAVCPGSAALIPDIPGLSEAGPWTNRDATGVQDIPASLVILGGGVVAAEMATVFTDLGSAVTMVVRSRLLRGVEPFAADAVRASLTHRGVDIREGIAVAAARRIGGSVHVMLADGRTVTGDEVLCATGRLPRTTDLGVDAVGLVPGAWLDVDDTQRVRGSDWLYAVGDVNHRAALTHQGKYQARAAGDVIVARAFGRPVDDRPWGAHVATADHAAVPQAIFTDPEIAAVGLTEAQAREKGLPVRVLDHDLSWIAGAATWSDDYRGRARAVVDTDREVLVGATFVGPEVAELVHAATIAVVAEVPLERLWHAVPPYPTVSEVWLRWLEEYGRSADRSR